MAGSAESSSLPEDSEALLKDPFLDYINDILMEEGADDDATCLQQADAAYSNSLYEAIFSSLHGILTGSPPVSPGLCNDAAYLHQVEGMPNYRAIFSSLQEIVRADSVPTSHCRSELPHIENSPAVCRGSAMKLQLDDETRRNNLCSASNCDVEHAMPQNYEGRVLKFNHGVLSDVVTMEGSHKQTNGTFKLPASEGHFAGLEVSFEDLKLHNVYTSLYVQDKPSSANIASRNDRHKPKSTAYKGKFFEKHTSKVLISCAEAVAKGNVQRATQILQEIHQMYGASGHERGLQHVAYIFSRALAVCMRGTGVQEYDAMSHDRPSSAAILRAARLDFEMIPYKMLVHYYANQSIVEEAEGASRLHIVDYNTHAYGLQWPCLINALADCKGVSPLLVITFIGLPQTSLDMARRLEQSGQRLAAYAKTYNVPFEYHVIVIDKWEDLDAASLKLCTSSPEVLIVNCMKCLRLVPDDTITLDNLTISTRQKLFAVWRSLNPRLLVTTVVNGAHNSPFFVTRFREALDFFTNGFDMLDILWGDIPERPIMTRRFYYRTIMNIVACEGVERVERSENYRQWHGHITKAGFAQVPIPLAILSTSKLHIKQHYHKDFFVDDDGKGWMLMGWKGRATLAVSAWKPAEHVLRYN